MKTQEQFAEEILEQCMNGTSISNLMAKLEEYRIQLASQLEPLVMQKIAEVIDNMIFANNMYWDEDVSFLSKTKKDYYNKSLEELKIKLSNLSA